MKHPSLKTIGTGIMLLLTTGLYAVSESEPNDTYLTADITSPDVSSTGTAGYGSNYDWWEITLPASGNLTITTTPSTVTFLWCYLYDNDGTTLLASNFSAGTFNIGRDDLAAGTYYIMLRCYYVSDSTDYDFTPAYTAPPVADDDEPNGTFAAANMLGLNDSTTGLVGYYYNLQRDTADWYMITTVEDGPLYIYLESLNGTFTWAYLFDSDGATLLASNYSTSAFSINRQDLAAGTYYVRVNTYYSNNYTPYKIRNQSIALAYENDIESNNTAATAIEIEPNTTAEGHVGYYNNGSRDMEDWYKITTGSDGILNFTLTPALGQFIWMFMYDSDGTTIIQSSFNTTTFSVIRNDLAEGTYYLKVSMYYGNGYTSYTLSNTATEPAQANDAEPNNDYLTASPLQTNTIVEGHIGYYNSGARDQYDYYGITLSSPGDLTLSIDAINDIYIYLLLYASDGVTYLGGSYGYGSYAFTQNDLAAGNYIVRTNAYYAASDFSPYVFTNTYCPDYITIIAEGETTFCEGESVVLSTPDHHLSYLWNDGSVTETNVVTLTGDHYLTIDNGGGCVRTSNTISTESTPLPVATIDADGPVEFCEGGDVTLSVGVTPDTYLWSTGETTPTITVSATGDYDVVLTKNGCSAISDPIHIEVNPNPVAAITPDGPTTFCEGGTVILNATPASDYAWSNGATTASITVDADGDYSVTITDANGCSDMSDIITVTENPNPIAGISADGPTTFCSGESVNLIATGGTSYLWSNGETSASINVTTGGDYSVTVYSAEGCSDISDIISVSVEACGSVSISADGPTEFCEGGSVTLISSEVSGNVWNTGETTQSIVVTASGDYYCVNGVNTSNIISVTVTANPDATISADGPTTFCAGGNVTLSAIAGYDSYLWSDGSTSSSIFVTTGGSYSVVINHNGCESISSSIDVTVNAIPAVGISSASTLICYEGFVELTVTTDGFNLQWQRNETDIPGATGAIYSATENGKYTCTASNGTCSTVSNMIKLKYAERVPTTPAGTASLCGPSLTMSIPSTPGATYQWYQDNEAIAGATSSIYNTSTTGKFYCLVYKDGCTRASKLLTVNDDCRLTASNAAGLSVSPNPAFESFTIDYSIEQNGPFSIVITDMTGRIIMQENKNPGAGNYSDRYAAGQFASGIYVVTLIHPDGKASQQKLVIEK